MTKLSSKNRYWKIPLRDDGAPHICFDVNTENANMTKSFELTGLGHAVSVTHHR